MPHRTQHHTPVDSRQAVEKLQKVVDAKKKLLALPKAKHTMKQRAAVAKYHSMRQPEHGKNIFLHEEADSTHNPPRACTKCTHTQSAQKFSLAHAHTRMHTRTQQCRNCGPRADMGRASSGPSASCAVSV